MQILNRLRQQLRPSSSSPIRFDENFYRRLDRLTLQVERTLRGRPGGEHPSTWALPSAEFTQHRPYTKGDDPRYVDWAVYARSDQHFIRLGETTQEIRVHLLIDHSASMAWGRPWTKLDSACQIAAMLGHISLAGGDVLRVAPLTQQIGPGFGPVTGKARSQALLQYLSKLRPVRGTALAAPLSDYIATQQTKSGLLIVLSDLWTLEVEELDTLLARLRPPRWQVIVFHLLDPAELVPPALGETELEDLETGQRVALRLEPATIAAYQSELQSWFDHLSRTCTRHGATLVRLDTSWTLDTVIIPFLVARRVLQT